VGPVFAGLIMAFVPLLADAESLSFAWLRNNEPDVVGYRIHYGVASRAYNTVRDVGNATGATINNLTPGTTYYFALGAYNTLGLESDLTGELVYSVPIKPAGTEIRLTSANPPRLTVLGPVSKTFSIESTTDLQTWTSIGAVTVGPTGSSSFTDTNKTVVRRFYRARALP
jgi:hypothetical protein